jgi:hypothetical protein
MAARTKTKVTPKYKTKYRVKNMGGVRYRSQRTRRHHGLVRRGVDVRMERVPKRSPRRAAQVLRLGDRNRIDLANGLPCAAAADGRLRRWRKLHLGIDGDGCIIASALTDSSSDDAYVGLSIRDRCTRPWPHRVRPTSGS